MARVLPKGGTIIVPWHDREVRATVVDVRGSYPRTEVVAELSPELSGPVVEQALTVALPLRNVRRVGRPI